MHEALFPTARSTRLLDTALAVWVVAWLLVAAAVAWQVHELRQLSDTVVSAGEAAESSGSAVTALSAIPGIGDDVAELGERAVETGRRVQASGRRSGDNIETLAVLLGLAIGLVPTAPLVLLYLPARMQRSRDVRTVRRVLSTGRADAAFEEFLARRAAQHLPYHRLREVSENPWRDLEVGRHDRLATAELERLGIARPPRRGGPGSAA